MKKLIIFLIVLFSVFKGFSQCTINPWIQINCERDAKFLLLRDILENPSDPDFDNPFINEARLTPYLEKLSAIYENPNNHSVIDSLFNEFQIHANPEYASPVAYYNRMEFAIDNTTPWLEDFKNTGISGVAALDNLMTTYQFFIDEFIVFNTAGYTAFYIETTFDVLNITALVDDFEIIPELFYIQPTIRIEDRFNYTGIPYELAPLEFVEVCNIDIHNDIFTFGIFAGDCPVGCLLSKTWNIRVTEDCEVTILATPEIEVSKFIFYPNPVLDKLYLKGNSSEIGSFQIFSIQGKLLQKLNNISTEINVSQLKAGIYFIEIITSERNKNIQKFIKN
jgi:hypothetical protein